MRGQFLKYCILVAIAYMGGDYSGLALPAVADDISFEAYVASQPHLSMASEDSSLPVYAAANAIKAARKIGLGTCTLEGAVETRLYALSFGALPKEACGDGWFSGYCISSWQNCVTTKVGIICDHNYLGRLYLLQRVVLSTHAANPTSDARTPTDAMLRLARLAKLSGESQVYAAEANQLLRAYSWKTQGRKDNYYRLLVEIGVIGAVIFHELAHVEQTSCALGHTDPRYTSARTLLEKISCRALPPAEIRADMRALDAGAMAAGMIERFHKDEFGASTHYLRAVVTRLEYEAMIQPLPEYAVEMYSNEPGNPSLLWNYYFDAGANYPAFRGSGHIPPELRPIAAINLLRKRGFLTSRGLESVYSLCERLRPFLTGVLWARCKRESPPETVRDFIDMLMFDKGPFR